MADRRSLLDTGKDIGQGVAGTLRSAAGTIGDKADDAKESAQSLAGTLAQKGREGGQRARSLAGTLADTGRTGVGRARSVAGTLGDRASAVREEFEDLTDSQVTENEANRIQRAGEEAQSEVQQTGGEFGREFAENLWMEAYDMELQEQKEQRQRQQAPQERNRREAQFQNTMAFGGFANPAQGKTQDPPPQVEQLFGVSSRGRDETEQIAPLFGLRY